VSKDSVRGYLLAAIASHLPEVKRLEAVRQAYEATLSDDASEYDRAGLLAKLTPYLSSDQRWTAVKAALSVGNKTWLKDYFDVMTPYLDSDQLQIAFKEVMSVADKTERSSALTALAAHLSPDQCRVALESMSELDDKPAQIDTIAVLAPYLSSKQLEKTLNTALTIPDERKRANAMAALVPCLALEQCQVALDAALEFENKSTFARTLDVLAPHLSPKQIQSALDAILLMHPSYAKVRALAVLIPHLPPYQQQEMTNLALETLSARESDTSIFSAREVLSDFLLRNFDHLPASGDKARCLAILAPYLSAQERQRRFEAVLDINDEPERGTILVAFAPYLSLEQCAIVLDNIQNFKDYHDKYAALTFIGIAPYLSPDQYQAALDAILGFNNRFLSVLAAHDIILHLPDEQRERAWQEVRNIALTIYDESERAYALAVLTTHLPPDQHSIALETALAIRDKYIQALTLASILPWLPEGQLSERLVSIRLTMLDHLSVVANGMRSEVLSFCREVHFFSPPILSPAMLSSIAEDIHEICDEWRWL